MKREKIRNWVGALLMWPFKLFPIKKNRIYFIARYGRGFNCNPRAYFEYLYKNHHDEFEFVWCLNQDCEDLPRDVKRVKFMSLRDQYYLHTSKYVINNMRFSMLFSKRKKQIYIMTTHGGSIAYKKVEKDQNLSPIFLWNSKIDSSQMDALLAGSKQEQQITADCFFCENKTYLTGLPRCDQLVNPKLDDLADTRKKLNISADDFIILYAPTFREYQSFESLLLNNQMIKDNFEKVTKKNVKILYRFHPYLLKNRAKQMHFEDFVLNVTDYPEMQDLISISDVLITDFSSCMFDMLIANKLCILYHADAERYLSKERGVYIPEKELPFPIANDEINLQKLIENFNETLKEYQIKAQEFTKIMECVEDGHSCERVYELMMGISKKK